jgi:hypothetical protein
VTPRETTRTAVRVPADVHEGLEAVRLSGLTNMLDRPAVAQIAAGMGYDACARWVREHRALYARGIFQGFEADGGRDEARTTPALIERAERAFRSLRAHGLHVSTDAPDAATATHDLCLAFDRDPDAHGCAWFSDEDRAQALADGTLRIVAEAGTGDDDADEAVVQIVVAALEARGLVVTRDETDPTQLAVRLANDATPAPTIGDAR